MSLFKKIFNRKRKSDSFKIEVGKIYIGALSTTLDKDEHSTKIIQSFGVVNTLGENKHIKHIIIDGHLVNRINETIEIKNRKPIGISNDNISNITFKHIGNYFQVLYKCESKFDYSNCSNEDEIKENFFAFSYDKVKIIFDDAEEIDLDLDEIEKIEHPIIKFVGGNKTWNF